GKLASQLINTGIKSNIGFCPVGAFNPNIPLHIDPIQNSHQIAHILLGGHITSAQINDENFTKTISIDEMIHQDLKTYLSKKLPSYMIPHHYVLIDEFKLTSTGKIDIKALPLPKLTSAKELIKPFNKTQEKLLTIWKKSLNKDVISIEDNFFEMG